MMAVKWTTDQEKAIESRNGTILVSAAAGSGKTAVLVERIIKQITSSDDCNIDEILVMTFTKAAAKEMADRLSDKIRSLLGSDPFNAHLLKQRNLIPVSSIGTIDKFCASLVKEHYEQLNISPNFKVLEESKAALLKDEAMKNVISRMYNDSEFNKLATTLSNGRDDRQLISTVYQIYDFIMAHPFPYEWLDRMADSYNYSGEISGCEAGKILISDLETSLYEAISSINAALYTIASSDEANGVYYEHFAKIKKTLEYILSDLNGEKGTHWDDISKNISALEFPRFPVSKKVDAGIKESIKYLRERAKKVMEPFRDVFSVTCEDFEKINKSLYPLVLKLNEVVKAFHEEFSALKREKNALDFSDLEHFAIELLIDNDNGNHQKSKICESVAEKYKYILVDEFQDINMAQDMIIRAVSRDENNIFMVGDVKQSIYSFRQAEPSIFINKKNSLDLYKKDVYPGKIILGKNFRSQKNITDVINTIFQQIMSKKLGDIEYNQEEWLFGKRKDINDDNVEYHLLECDKDTKKEEAEAEYIANLIYDIVEVQKIKIEEKNGVVRNVNYSDIAVLLRSFSGKAPAYVKALEKKGVPVSCDANKGFLTSEEIKWMLAILSSINNHSIDVDIVGAMTSPAFGFTSDDMAKIKVVAKNNKCRSFYNAMVKMVGDVDSYEKVEDQRTIKKIASFLNFLKDYKGYASVMTTWELIVKIYNDTGFFAIISSWENGELRAANLKMLIFYAKQQGEDGMSGLDAFLRYIRRVIDNGMDLASGTVVGGKGAVQVMSIHKSKGLEFPVCIVAGLSGKFNKSDLIDAVLVDSKLGVGVDVKDTINMTKQLTVQKQAIRLSKKQSMISEELRILYVALTRARDKLIMVNTVKDVEKHIQNAAEAINLGEIPLFPSRLMKMDNFGDMITAAMLRKKECKELFEKGNVNPIFNDELGGKVKLFIDEAYNNEEKQPETDAKKSEETTSKDFDQNKIDYQINFRYPFEKSNKLLAKISVSDIVKKDHTINIVKRPRFAMDKKLTAGEIGTLTHKFLQCINYENININIDEEKSRIISQGYMTKEQVEAVNMEDISRFILSDLFDKINHSNMVLKEWKFNMLIDAKNVFGVQNTDEKTVLQGVVDCAFKTEKGFVIVDYKTDNTKDVELLKERYHQQLELYVMAVEKSFGEKVVNKYIYSTKMGSIIEV